VRALVLAAALALSGCFDSLVGGECGPGWIADNGVCRPAVAGDDGGDDPIDGGDGDRDAATAASDAGTCDDAASWCGGCVDLASDPDHCGACQRSCGSGICSAGTCAGTISGHVVLIGHDYRAHHAAAARLLGNAVALGSDGVAVRVAIVGGATDAEVVAGVNQALWAGSIAAGRTWSPVDLGGAVPDDRSLADVVLFLPRSAAPAASFAAGQAWQPSLAGFVAAGGKVIALDGAGTSTAEILRGAGLTASSAGASATDARVTIAAPGDALAIGVPSPYLAERSSATFTMAGPGTVVATAGGDAIAVHITP
jgi:hypothetical protein